MLLNDKVKVSWKTNCQWRDKPRWPKRKEIKLPQGEIGETSTMPLKTGDRVKIKFGSHWYHAEVAEDWQAKSKKVSNNVGSVLDLFDLFEPCKF